MARGRARIERHGANHSPGGADPIPGLGEGGGGEPGIQYELFAQTGGWLDVRTNDAAASKAIRFYDTAGRGIDIRAYGSSTGNTAAVDIYGEDAISIVTAAPSSGGSGDIVITAGDDILITATDTLNIRATNGDCFINGDDKVDISADAGPVWVNAPTEIGLYGGDVRLARGSGKQLIFDGLPTTNPGIAGAVWNDGGTLNRMTRTLTLTSPLQRGPDVRAAQAKLILGGWLRKGGNDSVYGPETARAAGAAHWWLGFPQKLARSQNYGDVLDKVLTEWLSSKTLPEGYQVRREERLGAVTLGSKALEWLRGKVGETENPPGSNQIEWATGWYRMSGPWCAMAVTRAYVEAGSKGFVRSQRWAYVPYMVADARAGANGLSRTFDPQPGDLFCVDWQGGSSSAASNSVYAFDHVGLVDRPPKNVYAGATYTSVEGNTSFESAGPSASQSNGGACAARTRTVIGGGSTIFIRVLR